MGRNLELFSDHVQPEEPPRGLEPTRSREKCRENKKVKSPDISKLRERVALDEVDADARATGGLEGRRGGAAVLRDVDDREE